MSLSKEQKKVKNCNFYSEAFKRQVVSEINQGVYSVLGAMKKYDIGGKMTVYNWVAKYNKSKKLSIGGKEMADNKKSAAEDLYARIRQLEQVVSDLSIENKILKTTIEIADEVYKTDLKKNFATLPSKNCIKKKIKD